ncbi:MAG: hypothetical protein HN519_04955 [Hellea sp.]|jgi:hypothetical protein|nr:hypothetical protein [Hellea sp.]
MYNRVIKVRQTNLENQRLEMVSFEEHWEEMLAALKAFRKVIPTNCTM